MRLRKAILLLLATAVVCCARPEPAVPEEDVPQPGQETVIPGGDEPEEPGTPGTPQEPSEPGQPGGAGTADTPQNPEGPDSPQPPQGPDEPEDPDEPGTPETPQQPEDPDDGLPRTIHNGDRILVTNETVERFLSEVHYDDNDYTYTGVTDYPVAPGESDIPPSFTIRWPADAAGGTTTSAEATGNTQPAEAAGSVTATLRDGEWTATCTIPADEGNHWVVSNLRPDAHYIYTVTSSQGKVLTQGEFDTYGRVHQVFFDTKVRNARDLGGWRTGSGRTVKYRKLYRGGRMNPAHLSEKGRQDLLAEGIRAQLDLRGTDRISQCAFGDGHPFFAPYLTAGYLTMLGPDADKTKACFDFILNCLKEDKPVYFHCSAGRDRTGTMAMLLLGLLGVPEGDISQEYELSLFAPLSWSLNDGETTVQTRLASYKVAVTHIWNLSRGQGFTKGIENFFLSIGVPQTDIAAFRSRMLE